MSQAPHRRTDRGPPEPAPTTGDVPTWTGDRPPQIRSPLDFAGPATATTATSARRQFGAWLAVDLKGDLLDDLVLVVYEAMANAADHAYPTPGTGPVRLTAHRTRPGVHITVSDHGTWRDTPARDTPATVTFRGRGLLLIRQLVPDVHIEHTADGTTVHLRVPVPLGNQVA